jgi:hypothetical protein
MKEPKIDEKTRDYLRRWGRHEVPTAQITGGKVNPGTYRGLATLGWIERRGPISIVGVHFLVLQNQAYTPMATLSVAMPVTKNTELLINSFLHYVGWDGRVWPYDRDGGWPKEDSDDAKNLRDLMTKTRPKIASTLTFPSEAEGGAPLIEVPIVKRSAPFPWAPFEPVSEDRATPAEHLERFRELCQDPSPFQPPN